MDWYAYFYFHLTIEGIIETSIITVEIKKIKWIELKNLSATMLVKMVCEICNEPEKSCSAVFTESTFVIIKKTRLILNEFPIMTKVVLIPADTPLLPDGTEHIIEARLGDAKMPIPAPTKSRGITIS